MRKYFISMLPRGIIAAAYIAMSTGLSLAQEIDSKSLPQAVKSFISENLGNEEIKISNDDLGEYEIKTASGTEVEINAKGVWSEITNEDKGLSSKFTSLLPYPAALYLKTNYNNVPVEKIKRSGKNYIVELISVPQKSKLLFNGNGKMKKIMQDY